MTEELFPTLADQEVEKGWNEMRKTGERLGYDPDWWNPYELHAALECEKKRRADRKHLKDGNNP